MKTKLDEINHLYLGCKCVLFEDGKLIGKPFKFTETTEFNLSLPLAIENKLSVKLLLRPDFSLTLDELDKWNKIETPVGEMCLESAQKIHWNKKLKFYRSVGIDCDDLIKKGYAFDITTWKQ